MTDNFFNNLIRDGYYQSTHKPPNIINAPHQRLETDILLNGKQLFADKNNMMKSLTDENKSLKERANIIYEKEDEISELKSLLEYGAEIAKLTFLSALLISEIVFNDK